jgi:hypothetical protein
LDQAASSGKGKSVEGNGQRTKGVECITECGSRDPLIRSTPFHGGDRQNATLIYQSLSTKTYSTLKSIRGQTAWRIIVDVRRSELRHSFIIDGMVRVHSLEKEKHSVTIPDSTIPYIALKHNIQRGIRTD